MHDKYITFPFTQNGVELTPGRGAPVAGMTVRAAGSMRFRWNETNPNRDKVLQQLAGELCKTSNPVPFVSTSSTAAAASSKTSNPVPFVCSESPVQTVIPVPFVSTSSTAAAASSQTVIPVPFVPVELIHSHIVYDVHSASDTLNLQGDGIITTNSRLIPTVTVADCMPVFLWNPVTKVFGIVHSGWKGTGIAADAINLAVQKYGSSAGDFCVILGPHIQDCCYIVNQERADFFKENFGSDCVKPLEQGGNCYCGGRGLPVAWNNGGGQLYRLSLKKANLYSLEKAGVKRENINVIEECTCCNQKFGSNRRETVLNRKPDCFTVQAAFISAAG